MGNDKRELAAFLKTVAQWDWHQFLQAEADPTYTTRQSIVFAMIRAAAMENLGAITTAISRLDGKVEVPVQVVTPKVYYVFPNATSVAEVEAPPQLPEHQPNTLAIRAQDEPLEMPSHSFRETMDKMATLERTLPTKIITCQEQWEAFARGRGRAPEETVKVSSVVAARLLHMAQQRDMRALDEVFNQLDGKLVETVRIVGEDMYIAQFSSVAPPGAVKNGDGIYQVEAPQRTSQVWGERLDPAKKGLTSVIIEE